MGGGVTLSTYFCWSNLRVRMRMALWPSMVSSSAELDGLASKSKDNSAYSVYSGYPSSVELVILSKSIQTLCSLNVPMSLSSLFSSVLVNTWMNSAKSPLFAISSSYVPISVTEPSSRDITWSHWGRNPTPWVTNTRACTRGGGGEDLSCGNCPSHTYPMCVPCSLGLRLVL